MNSRFESPDGELVLLVQHHSDGDISVGFEGSPWHTHPECIVPEYYSGCELNEFAALDRLLSDIIEDRLPICIERGPGSELVIWPAPEPMEVLTNPHVRPDAAVEIRYWSGAEWKSG